MKQLLSLVVLFCLVFAAHATPVGPMNYQGRLLDAQGIPLTGSYNFVVKIYNDPVAGTLKYQEQHDGVAVDDGVYSFKVGTGTNKSGDSEWDVSLWQQNLNDLFMEIMVNGETLSPRHELTSAPHAYTATLALSLGNKTAEEFDNILEGICVASKGKWLTKVDKCLGREAVFATSVTLADLQDTVDTNFTNLDLSDADLRGINFSGADFSGSTFTRSKVDMSKFANTNLSNTRWENAQNVGSALAGGSTINLSNAWIKNFSGLAGSNFNSATVTGLSAAYLPACPGTVGVKGSNLPAEWRCLQQSTAGQYFLVGPYANLSAKSALAVDNYGVITLPIPNGALDGTAGSLSNLQGVNFGGVDFFQASLKYINLQNAVFDYGELKYTNLIGSNLTGASLVRTDMQGAVIPGGLGYNNQNLSGITIEVETGQTYILTGTTLTNSSIIVAAGATFKLTYGTLNDVTITTKEGDANTASIDIQNSSVLSSSIAVKNIKFVDTEVFDSTAYPDATTSTAELIATNANFYGGRFDVAKMTITDTGFYNQILFRFEGSNANASISGLTTVLGGAIFYVNPVTTALNNINCSGGQISKSAMNITNSILSNGCKLNYSGTAQISNSTIENMGTTSEPANFAGSSRDMPTHQASNQLLFGVNPNVVFNQVTFNGTINFGYAIGGPSFIQITNSVFAADAVVEMSSMHPITVNPMVFYIENTNFLDGVQIYGANSAISTPTDGQVILVNNYFDNTSFNTHLDSAYYDSGTHRPHVLDGNSFRGGQFAGAMGTMIVNNNNFEGISNASDFHGSSGNTYVDGYWYCPGYPDSSSWGNYFSPGQFTAQYALPEIYTSNLGVLIHGFEDCESICASGGCGVSVGNPPTGRGNPN